MVNGFRAYLERIATQQPQDIDPAILSAPYSENVRVAPRILPPEPVPEPMPMVAPPMVAPSVAAPAPVAAPIPRGPGVPNIPMPGAPEMPGYMAPEYEESRLSEILTESKRPRMPLIGQLLGAMAGPKSMYGPLVGYQPVQAQVEQEAQRKYEQDLERKLEVQRGSEQQQRRGAELEADYANRAAMEQYKQQMESRAAAQELRDWYKKQIFQSDLKKAEKKAELELEKTYGIEDSGSRKYKSLVDQISAAASDLVKNSFGGVTYEDAVKQVAPVVVRQYQQYAGGVPSGTQQAAPAQDMVAVINPKGVRGNIPASQLTAALKQGYKRAK